MKTYRQVAGSKSASHVFRFDADDRARDYVMADSYCENPLCEGNEAVVHLVSWEKQPRRIRMSLDLVKGCAALHSELAGTERQIAEEFLRDPRTCRILARRRQLVRAWGLARWKHGPVVSREDRCYSLVDFDMQGEQHPMPFESDGSEWVTLDQYCVEPTCDCQESLLSFFACGKGAEGARHERFAARLDLKTGAAVDARTQAPLEAEAWRVLQDFLDEVKAWRHELSLRRKFIRQIAAHRLRRPRRDDQSVELTPVLAPPAVPTPGRNDPCPCGSGRKFKKCCGLPRLGTPVAL